MFLLYIFVAVQKLILKNFRLQIEGEQLFVDVSGVLAAAMHWEERAAHIFATEAQMSDFEDVIRFLCCFHFFILDVLGYAAYSSMAIITMFSYFRTSKDIHVILPSLDDVKDAISMAKSWLKNSKPFLGSSFPATHPSCSLLKVEALKVLIVSCILYVC